MMNNTFMQFAMYWAFIQYAIILVGVFYVLRYLIQRIKIEAKREEDERLTRKLRLEILKQEAILKGISVDQVLKDMDA